MLTRRVRLRLFLLRPSKRTNQLIEYVLAVVSAKYGICVHAVVVLSNHWHVALTDPHGNIVEFQRDCHQFIARALNASHGEFESVWSNTQGSRVECEQSGDLVERIAYTMANPVEAGLVRHGHSWPGVRHAWPAPARVVNKPTKFFRGEADGGTWPEQAVLELSRPPGHDHLSDDDLATLIDDAIEQREQTFRDKYDAQARSFLGRRHIRQQSRHASPKTCEPRFGINPRVACRDKWRRIERLQFNKQWGADYNAALLRWHAGDRSVLFPPGTYLMRLRHGANCAQAPP